MMTPLTQIICAELLARGWTVAAVPEEIGYGASLKRLEFIPPDTGVAMAWADAVLADAHLCDPSGATPPAPGDPRFFPWTSVPVSDGERRGRVGLAIEHSLEVNAVLLTRLSK